MIYTLTMNPALDKTAEVEELHIGGLNRLQNLIVNPGGKGINVSKMLHILGKESIAMGFVAGINGQYIVDALDQLGIAHDMVEVEGNTRVNLKVLNKQRQLTELNEEGPTIQHQQLTTLCEKIVSKATKGDCVVVSGSVPTGISSDVYEQLIKQLKTTGTSVLLDADGELFKCGMQALPTVVKPNCFELCQYFGVKETKDIPTLISLGKQMLQKGIALLVISLGEAGAIFMKDELIAHVSGLKVEAHSSVGAGDAMVAAIACALENNDSFEQLIKLSVACSAGAVATQGTQPPTWKAVEELMKQVTITYR